MSYLDVKESIMKYESFVNDVLKKDLKVLEIKLQEINTELSNFVEQKNTLQVIMNKEIHPNGFQTQVNLGCNFFMEAAVKDTSVVLMNIGLNCYLEFTLPEVLTYLDRRIKVCEDQIKEIRNKTAEVKAHIKLTLLNIDKLQYQY